MQHIFVDLKSLLTMIKYRRLNSNDATLDTWFITAKVHWKHWLKCVFLWLSLHVTEVRFFLKSWKNVADISAGSCSMLIWQQRNTITRISIIFIMIIERPCSTKMLDCLQETLLLQSVFSSSNLRVSWQHKLLLMIIFRKHWHKDCW